MLWALYTFFFCLFVLHKYIYVYFKKAHTHTSGQVMRTETLFCIYSRHTTPLHHWILSSNSMPLKCFIPFRITALFILHSFSFCKLKLGWRCSAQTSRATGQLTTHHQPGQKVSEKHSGLKRNDCLCWKEHWKALLLEEEEWFGIRVSFLFQHQKKKKVSSSND